jgi:hypothetical protein
MLMNPNRDIVTFIDCAGDYRVQLKPVFRARTGSHKFTIKKKILKEIIFLQNLKD